MDQEPDVIRQNIDQTRSSLTEKLETLEGQVRGTVEGARATVDATIQNVKDTVQSVKRTFDIKYQTMRHPWPMVGGSVLAGFFAGALVAPARRMARRERGAMAYPERATSFTDRPVPPVSEEAARPNGAAASPAPRRGLVAKLQDEFQDEIDQLKSMAIGALAGIVRDLAKQYIPPGMAPQVDEIMNNVTTKLGGQPIHGSVLEQTGFGRR